MSTEIPRKAIAGRLRAARLGLGLTQDDVARAAWASGLPSFTRAVVAAVERGTRDLSLPELAVMLRILNLDLERLLRGVGPIALDQDVAVDARVVLDQLLGKGPQWDFTAGPSAAVTRGRHGAVLGYVKDEPLVASAERKAAAKFHV